MHAGKRTSGAYLDKLHSKPKEGESAHLNHTAGLSDEDTHGSFGNSKFHGDLDTPRETSRGIIRGQCSLGQLGEGHTKAQYASSLFVCHGILCDVHHVPCAVDDAVDRNAKACREMLACFHIAQAHGPALQQRPSYRRLPYPLRLRGPLADPAAQGGRRAS